MRGASPSRCATRSSRHGRGWVDLRRTRQSVFEEQGSEGLRLEQLTTSRTLLVECELGEHAPGIGRPCGLALPPQLRERRAQLLVTLCRIEDPPDHELWRDGPVPVVLLETKCHVEEAGGT